MLSVYTSNRLEVLVERLAQTLAHEPAAPFERETIVVQSRGMERWLSLKLADMNGVCADVEFPFPNALIDRVTHAVMPGIDPDALFEREAMKFYIMRLLPDCLDRPEFRELQHYLAANPHVLKLYQLAGRIAGLYDQYLVFRPDMIMGWENGHDQHWQASLWRRMTGGKTVLHKARLHRMIIDTLNRSTVAINGFPTRLFVFGISHLPMYHMQILEALAHQVSVSLYTMNPCQAYWGDIVSEQEETRQTLPHDTAIAEALHFERGNPLLASLGGMGRGFFELLNGLEAEVIELFQQTPSSGHLATIQSDILNLRQPAPTKGVNQKPSTVRIHVCHSALREVEVLHDQLLEMFQSDPRLQPQDVLVMTPEIATYAPYIRAVFEAPDARDQRIPFSIADQSVRGSSRTVKGFLSLLDLKQSRFGTAEVMAVLSAPGIMPQFGLQPEDIPLIENWIEQTRIRWGIDAADRKALGFPAYDDNSWRRGILRSLLGYAMSGHRYRMFNDLLPLDEMEGHTAEALGRFFTFLEQLFTFGQKLRRPRPPLEWEALLLDTLATFFAEDDQYSQEQQFIRETIQDMAQRARQAGMTQPLTLEVMKAELAYQFTQTLVEYGFLAHGVTFAAMLPMRSIPFKIICLMGMNHDVFPRDARSPSFDIMTQHPRMGDRSRRQDDKYIFLESILSAREILYVSFIGRDVQDNALMPPSVVVEELIDYLCAMDGTAREAHVVHHPLQPFAKMYFKTTPQPSASHPFSFSREFCRAARTREAHTSPKPFFDTPLPEPNEAWRALDLPTLKSFWQHPVRFLLQQRLDIVMEDSAHQDVERESFNLDGLGRYDLEQSLFEMYRNGVNLASYRQAARAQNLLPPGTTGDLIYDDACLVVEAFAGRVDAITAGAVPRVVENSWTAAGFAINLRLPQIFPQGIIHTRFARMHPAALLGLWIDHLALCLHHVAQDRQASLLVCRDEIWRLTPVDDAARLLERILVRFARGLVAPLPFFPVTSHAYAWQRLIKKQARASALVAARRKWEPGHFSPVQGEGEDPYTLLGFRGVEDVLGEGFQQLAEEIWTPLLASAERVDTGRP